MRILKKLSITAAGAVVVATALATDTAQAITVTTSPYDSTTCGTLDSCISSQTGVTTVNFNSGSAPSTGFAIYNPSGDTAIRSGSLGGSYTSPLGDTTAYLAVGPSTSNSVTINFAGSVDYFGLYWGSIDEFNSISFFRNGSSNPFATYSGSEILAAFDSTQVSSNASRYVNFFANNKSEYFNQMVLSSTRSAFESDNHAYRAALVTFESSPGYGATPVPFEFSPKSGILALGTCGAVDQLRRKLQNRKFSGSAFSHK